MSWRVRFASIPAGRRSCRTRPTASTTIRAAVRMARAVANRIEVDTYGLVQGAARIAGMAGSACLHLHGGWPVGSAFPEIVPTAYLPRTGRISPFQPALPGVIIAAYAQ